MEHISRSVGVRDTNFQDEDSHRGSSHHADSLEDFEERFGSKIRFTKDTMKPKRSSLRSGMMRYY